MPSHGSLSKAGKMRDRLQFKRGFREEEKVSRRGKLEKRKYYHHRKHKCPRVANRKRYERLLRSKTNLKKVDNLL